MIWIASAVAALAGVAVGRWWRAITAEHPELAAPAQTVQWDGSRLHIRNRNSYERPCECCGNTIDCDCA